MTFPPTTSGASATITLTSNNPSLVTIFLGLFFSDSNDFSRSIKFHMSTENFADTQEKAQLVRDFLMDSKTFQDYGIINAKKFFILSVDTRSFPFSVDICPVLIRGIRALVSDNLSLPWMSRP